MTLPLAILFAAATLVIFLVGAAVAGVVLRLVLRGPSAAAEAYSRGESILSWWRARHEPGSSVSARLDQRLALAGRRSRKFGTVMVEERASQPSYGR